MERDTGDRQEVAEVAADPVVAGAGAAPLLSAGFALSADSARMLSRLDPATRAAHVLALSRREGNATVARLFAASAPANAIQRDGEDKKPKLDVKPGNPFEAPQVRVEIE
jgi:hypothetical protein